MTLEEILQILNDKILENITIKKFNSVYIINNADFCNSLINIYNERGIIISRDYKRHATFLKTAFTKINSLNDLILFINTHFLNVRNKISVKKLIRFCSINPNIKNSILLYTENFPKEITLNGRCLLLKDNITTFPMCAHCHKKPVALQKKCRISTYCSQDCAAKSINTKTKTKQTLLIKYGNENFVNIDKIKETKLEKYGDKNFNNSKKSSATKVALYGENWGKNWYKGIEKELINNFGVSNFFETEEFKSKSSETKLERYGDKNYVNRAKAKETSLIRYNVEYPAQNIDILKKQQKTNIEKYGFISSLQNEEVKTKIKITNLQRYGCENTMQNPKIFQKNQKSGFKVKPYKKTTLTYQGSYEKYFLEQIEGIGLLNEITKPDSVNYIFNDENHVYYPDFKFRGKIIEIKSTWTYNKNGKDLILEEKNNTKWETVKNNGKEIFVLFNKEEIKEFVDNIMI